MALGAGECSDLWGLVGGPQLGIIIYIYAFVSFAFLRDEFDVEEGFWCRTLWQVRRPGRGSVCVCVCVCVC
jgi:hypothetical protein